MNYQKRSLIFRIWIKNTTKCKSQLKKPQKMSPKQTKIQTRDQHPKGPFSTFGCRLALFKCRLAQTRAMAQGHLDRDKAHSF